MQLRDHPLMSYRGLPNWPPVWTCISGQGSLHPKGEIGVLIDVTIASVDAYNRCFLTVEFGDGAFMGCLLFEDRAFCREVFNLLKRYCGYPLEFIGGLDVTHTL